MVATLAHPAGPLQVVAACLEYEPAYNDDRIAQAQALVDLATDPALDGPLPVIVARRPQRRPNSPVCAHCRTSSSTHGPPAAATRRR
jgi:hypothetical protein